MNQIKISLSDFVDIDKLIPECACRGKDRIVDTYWRRETKWKNWTTKLQGLL